MISRKDEHRAYYLHHREAEIARAKKWRKDNPERARETQRKRLAKKKAENDKTD